MHHTSEISEVETRRRNQRAKRSDLARFRGEDGGALIELGLMLPFLALIVFGTIDLGRAWALKNRLTNMAREGASYGQFYSGKVNGCTGADMTKAAQAEDPDVTIKAVTVTKTVSGTTTTLTGCSSTNQTPGTTITVKVTADMKVFTPLASKFTGDPAVVGGYETVLTQGTT